MSNLEERPDEAVLEPESTAPVGPAPELLHIAARDVPLGGVRGITVHRTLPDRQLPTVGAWCFVDHFAAPNHRMELLPHPHIGLQTVTWPLVGRIRHRDSIGSDVVIAPGQLDLMTSGRGIAHSEFTAGEGASDLEAFQLWVALPADAATGTGGFEQHTDLPTWHGDGIEATVFLGELDGVRSPATVHTPIVGAQVTVGSGPAAIPLDPVWEHAVQLGDGSLLVDGERVDDRGLLYLGAGRDSVTIASVDGAPLSFLLLGGEPFTDELVMWWNFVGRSHEEIVAARTDWESRSLRFAGFSDHGDARIPAPPLPDARLTPRRRRAPLA